MPATAAYAGSTFEADGGKVKVTSLDLNRYSGGAFTFDPAAVVQPGQCLPGELHRSICAMPSYRCTAERVQHPTADPVCRPFLHCSPAVLHQRRVLCLVFADCADRRRQQISQTDPG